MPCWPPLPAVLASGPKPEHHIPSNNEPLFFSFDVASCTSHPSSPSLSHLSRLFLEEWRWASNPTCLSLHVYPEDLTCSRSVNLSVESNSDLNQCPTNQPWTPRAKRSPSYVTTIPLPTSHTKRPYVG